MAEEPQDAVLTGSPSARASKNLELLFCRLVEFTENPSQDDLAKKMIDVISETEKALISRGSDLVLQIKKYESVLECIEKKDRKTSFFIDILKKRIEQTNGFAVSLAEERRVCAQMIEIIENHFWSLEEKCKPKCKSKY